MKHLQAMIFWMVILHCLLPMAHAEMHVSRASICTGIEDREPVGTVASFTDTDKVYFFSEVKGADDNAQLKHLWYHNDKKVLEVDLSVKGPRWRTWSYKNIYHLLGSWRAEVVSVSGDVLHSESFTVY